MQNRSWILGAMALGAGLMYLLDPEHGTRRRARLSEHVGSWSNRSRRIAGPASRDLRGRTRGTLHTSRPHATGEAPDDVLVERVRARLGHVVAHARPIEVAADHGRVMLAGPIRRVEMDRAIEEVRSVPGVLAVENRLHSVDATSNEEDPTRRVLPRRLGRVLSTPSGRLLASTVGSAALAFGVYRLRRRLGDGAHVAQQDTPMAGEVTAS